MGYLISLPLPPPGRLFFLVPCASVSCPAIVLSAAGMYISLTFVVLPGLDCRIVLKALGRRGGGKREAKLSRVLNTMEGQGVGGYVGDVSSPFFHDGRKWC